MKPIISTTFSETVNGVRLFRDDIEDLISNINRKGFDIEIKDDSAVYTDIDELNKLKGGNNLNFEIEAIEKTDKLFKPRLSLGFKSNSVRIYASESELNRSFGFELNSFFKSKVPWHYKIFSPWYFGLVFIWLITPLIINYSKFSNSTLYLPAFWFSLAMLVLCFIAIILRSSLYGVTLMRKHEYGFWKRNKDKLLLTLLGAIIGSILTFLFQWLTK